MSTYDYLLKASKSDTSSPPPEESLTPQMQEVHSVPPSPKKEKEVPTRGKGKGKSEPSSEVPVEGKLSQNNSSTNKPFGRTVEPILQPNGLTERFSVISELEEGVRETLRATERYSFEIYTDQIEKIEEIQYQYKRKTGKRLSVSRIIREALDEYLKQAERAL